MSRPAPRNSPDRLPDIVPCRTSGIRPVDPPSPFPLYEPQLKQMREHGLMDNALILIHGNEIFINGRRLHGFQGQDRVLLVMMLHLAQMRPGQWFSHSELLESIEKNAPLLARWNWSIPRSPEATHRAMSKLRRVLKAALVNPKFLERSNRGIRVSVPSLNIAFVPPFTPPADSPAEPGD